MIAHRFLKPVVGVILLASLVTLAVLVRDSWLPLVTASATPQHVEAAPASEPQQVKLSPQAQGNLCLVAKPLKPDTYWRTIQVPGMVVDRPAYSDRGIVAPVTGVVAKVHRFPGDIVRPGDALFTLRVLSETLHLAQSELRKNTQEMQITKEQKKRLTDPAVAGAIATVRLIELDNQIRRLTVAAQAYRQELQTRGFTPDQINGVTEGKFVAEVVVLAPQPNPDKQTAAKQPPGEVGPVSYEVQELKSELGQQVSAGQTLGLLSNHQWLYVEGRAFRQETPFVERAARNDWPVRVEFMEDAETDWPALDQAFTIRQVANTIDPATRTFTFNMALTNQSRSFKRGDRTILLWRFRPGQKVRLHIRAEKFENVFVLPADAVVREGPEAYAFRRNGDIFERKPVRVVFQDRMHVVIANDGSIPPGIFVAQNGAVQLNRVLKSQRELPSGIHVHADGSVHANH